MKYLLTLLFFGLSGLLFAQEKKHPFEIAFSGGYASADLNWSIAGNSAGQSPNVLSEVKWNNLAGLSIGAELKVNLTKNWFLAGEFLKRFVKTGTATDSDYAQDDRSGRTYYAELRSDEGSLNEFSTSVGYYFLHTKQIKLAAFAGYNQSKENLLLLNKNDVAAGEKGLHTTYQTSWKGPSGGISANYNPLNKLKVEAKFVYSQLTYNATADWNLIDAFSHPISFTHYAKGFNLTTSLTVFYKLSRQLSLRLAGAYGNAQTGSGVDHLYLESGGTQTTQFNGAEKIVKSINAGVVFNF